MFKEINNDNDFHMIAMRSYENPKLVSIDKLDSDIRKISGLRIDITKYIDDNDDRRLRKILNIILIICNTFGVMHAIPMIRYKMKTTDQLILVNGIFEYLKYIENEQNESTEIIKKLEKI